MSQTVQRAIVIIEALAEQPRGLGDIAGILDVHRSTALRLLQTLEGNGFVRRRTDGQYAIGTRFISIAQQSLENLDLRPVASPHLRALHPKTGHTLHLAQLIGDEIIYIDKLESTDGVRMYSRIGRTASLYASGVGKTILAQLPPAQVNRLLERTELTSHTKTTFDDRAALDAELGRIRQRGWAVDDGEFEDFINCVAAPITNSSGDVVAAVSITALRVIAPLAKLSKLVPDLLETTRTISRELG